MFLGHEVHVLDDVFSALDRKTRWQVAVNLLTSKPGIDDQTIVYTTNDRPCSLTIPG